MVIREKYLEKVRPFIDSDLIKIITGIRRCGKSVILGQIKDEAEKKTDNIISLNFEDKYETGKIKTVDDLLQYVNDNRKDGKVYVFLDEIQELDGWQYACKTLRLHNASVFITGSNSKLLSGEFVKELSGRFVSFRVRPFVYKELLQYAEILGKNINTTNYLVWGGFPGRLEQVSEDAQLRYLKEIDSTIVLNDLIVRYKIRKTNLFSSLVNYVLLSNSRIFSAKSIYNYVKQSNESCSINTIMKYLDYLEQAYIIDKVNQYSTKVKKELQFFEKIYNSDVSFNTIRCQNNRYDLSHNLENIVYNELKYMDYNVQVFINKGREIDFLAQKDGKKYYIQVALSVAEEKAYEREFKAFDGLSQIDKKIIITNDELDYSTSNVQHIKFKDFLLMDDLS